MLEDEEPQPCTSSTTQILRLKIKASDDTIVEVDEDVASHSNYIKNKVKRLKKEEPDYMWLDRPIPVRKVDGNTMNKIFEWCTKHRQQVYIPKQPHEDPRITLTKEDHQYMDMTSEQLLAVLNGANDLGVPGIVDIITQKIADMAKGKSVEEIREIYCLHDDDEDPRITRKKNKKKVAAAFATTGALTNKS